MTITNTEVRFPGPPNRLGWVAFVSIAGAQLDEIKVRYRPDRRTLPWSCESCGPQAEPECIHAICAHAHATPINPLNGVLND